MIKKYILKTYISHLVHTTRFWNNVNRYARHRKNGKPNNLKVNVNTWSYYKGLFAVYIYKNIYN